MVVLRHLLNLLGRSEQALVAALGTTELALAVFSVVVPLFILIPSFVSKCGVRPWTTERMKDAARESIRPALWTIGITVATWLCLFSWFVGKAIYDDHQFLVAQTKKWMAISEQAQDALRLKQKESDAWKQKYEARSVLLQAGSSHRLRSFFVSPVHESKEPVMAYILTTNAPRTVDLVASCDFSIDRAHATVLTSSNGGSTQVEYSERISETKIRLIVESPAWQPWSPLWVEIFLAPMVTRMPTCQFSE